MPRPRMKRKVRFNPEVTYFKPAGIPLKELQEVILTKEEIESLRLINILELSQTEAAKKMEVSQPTFNRILKESRKKVSEAIIEGKAIKIEG
jgi:uncharacterized protein